MEKIMKTKQLILKIASMILCAVTIVPLFLNFIGLKNGDYKAHYKFASTSGSSDALLVIARILFIATIVVSFVLIVCMILQIFIKNDILDWVVLGTGIFVMVVATLCLVATLLYCLSISEIGKYSWFPAIGVYVLVLSAVGGAICSIVSNLPEKTDK